ncbi:MAG: DUF222 domain-containing protein [Acidimicrobiales bacterium]|nr:DUF222 domain-containing protein [Acidimicrobiales bacterium]
MRTELVDVHQAAEKLRGVVWANEPVATLEDSLVGFAQIRAMVDAAEIECLGVYDASKEWKATGALSAASRIAELTCGRQESIGWRRGLARKLRTMPHTVAAFELGDIGLEHVSLLCRANLFALAVEFARDEAMLVDKARTLPYDEFARELRNWRDAVDPEGTERRALSNYEERRVHASETFEGMGRLDGWMEPFGFHLVKNELDRHYQLLLDAEWADARARLGDAATVNDLDRTPAQRRHDALANMAEASREHGGVAAETSLGTTVVCDHATYLIALARILAAIRGEDPNQYRYPFERRCEFADGTPVTPEQAVWASVAGWIGVLAVDENGHALNFSKTRRFFTGRPRDATKLAFPVCDHASCSIRSVHCEIDHVIAWVDGGLTDAANGRPLCKGHNLWKEHQRAKKHDLPGQPRKRRTQP